MEPLCSACSDVSNNLHRILTSDLDLRTGIGKIEYTWTCDVAAALQAAAKGCDFCDFIKYVFLKPFYDPQSLGQVPQRAASKVDGLSDDEFSSVASRSRHGATACLVCSAKVSKGDAGLCYRCRPRVARYVAAHPDKMAEQDVLGMLPMTVSIRRASWALDENTDVEGLSLRGYMECSSRHALNTNETLFRVDCSSGKM